MQADIDRLDRGDETIFYVVSESGRDWAAAQYPSKYRVMAQIITFRRPAQEADLKQFIDGARKRGFAIRELEGQGA